MFSILTVRSVGIDSYLLNRVNLTESLWRIIYLNGGANLTIKGNRHAGV